MNFVKVSKNGNMSTEDPFGEARYSELADSIEELLKKMALFQTAKSKFHETEKELRIALDEYGKRREKLFETKWKERKIGWCTRRQHVAKEGEELKLLYIQEQQTRGSCETRGDVTAYELHTVCQTCFDDSRERSGCGGEFYAFKAEQREDGIYISRFGNWAPLPKNTDIFNPMPLPYKAPDLNIELPPNIRLGQDCFFQRIFFDHIEYEIR